MVKIYSLIFLFLVFILPVGVNAAGLFIDPSYGVYEVGDRITIKIKVSSDSSVNAVSGDISFPTSNFSIESISKVGSVLDFWVSEPSFSRGSGSVHLEGVSLNGFSGSSGTVLTVGVKVIKSGQSKVLFKSGQILANDGQGTDVTNKLIGADFTLNEGIKSSKITKPLEIETKKEVNVVGGETTQFSPTLKAPSIYYGNKYGNPAILGTSDYPNSKTVITFLSEDGSKVFITGTTDSSGEFISTLPNSLKNNKYKVSVVVIVNDDKNNTPVSNEIIITVGNIFSDIDNKLKAIIILLICSVVYLIFKLYTHFKLDKNIHYFIRKESYQADDMVNKTFSALKKEISDYAKNKTATDKKDIIEIKKDLDQAEELIKKEINDIKSL